MREPGMLYMWVVGGKSSITTGGREGQSTKRDSLFGFIK